MLCGYTTDNDGGENRQCWYCSSELKVAPTLLHFATQCYMASQGIAVYTMVANSHLQKIQSWLGWCRGRPVQQSTGSG